MIKYDGEEETDFLRIWIRGELASLQLYGDV
jgi:hypothetical protein